MASPGYKNRPTVWITYFSEVLLKKKIPTELRKIVNIEAKQDFPPSLEILNIATWSIPNSSRTALAGKTDKNSQNCQILQPWQTSFRKSARNRSVFGNIKFNTRLMPSPFVGVINDLSDLVTAGLGNSSGTVPGKRFAGKWYGPVTGDPCGQCGEKNQ